MFYLSGLTSAIIPSTITSIGLIVVIIIFIVLLLGDSAFSPCLKLKSVELTNGLVGLGVNMFQSSGLTSAIIPSTIASIGLIVVVIIFIVLSLGDGAFASCPNLLSVELTNGLVRLGANMFPGTGLTSVIIPSTIASIGLIVVVIFIDIIYLFDFITKLIIYFMTKYDIFIIYYHFIIFLNNNNH
jgi:hypothetical protein